MNTGGRAATAACSIVDALAVTIKAEVTSVAPSIASGAAAAIIDNTNARGSSADGVLEPDFKPSISVDFRSDDNGNDDDDDNRSSSNERQETDEESAVQSVAPRGSRGQSQAVLQRVDAPVSVEPPASRRRRRARRRELGDDCVAPRTRDRSGRPLAHRTDGVRATRSRVRAGEAYLVVGLN